MSNPVIAQRVIIVQIPSEVLQERLINERLTDENANGWRAVEMMDHNGLLIIRLERGEPAATRRQLDDDLEAAARIVESQSWPLDMIPRIEALARRLRASIGVSTTPQAAEEENRDE